MSGNVFLHCHGRWTINSHCLLGPRFQRLNGIEGRRFRVFARNLFLQSGWKDSMCARNLALVRCDGGRISLLCDTELFVSSPFTDLRIFKNDSFDIPTQLHN